jgi:hypothetical protein
MNAHAITSVAEVNLLAKNFHKHNNPMSLPELLLCTKHQFL